MCQEFSRYSPRPSLVGVIVPYMPACFSRCTPVHKKSIVFIPDSLPGRPVCESLLKLRGARLSSEEQTKVTFTGTWV